MLWILLGLITAAVLALLLWPLLKPPAAGAARARHDIEVYRDQLKEIETERARGNLGPAEAEAAKREIERRLLRAGDERETRAIPRAAATTALAVAVAVPIGAVALYLKLGQPAIPAQPLASRALPQAEVAARSEAGNIAEMAAKLADRLKENPNDLQGWMLLGRSYMQTERFDDAARAYARAAEIAPEHIDARMGAAESQVYAAQGVVTPKAAEAFEVLLKLDPKHPGARYYLALARGQAGDMRAAFDGWKALAADSAPDAPWQPALQARLREAAAALKIDLAEALPPSPAPRGPTPEQMQAAAGMSAEDRNAMIRGMVESLAERLKDNPNDAEGWARLARSYEVLGEAEKAKDARTKAEAAAKAPPAAPPRGPSQEQMQAAAKMAPEERQAMIRGMVDSLAARLQENPNDREGWVRLARSYEVLNEPAKAKDAWARAEALATGAAPPPPAPRDPLSAGQRAEMTRLVERLETRLKAEPGDAEGWTRLGQARAMLGQPKQARAAFAEALKLKPNDVELLIDHAGAVLDDEGSIGPIPPEADAIFRKVLALAPENLDALWYVGVSELQAGRRDVALVYWERLLGKLDPGSAEAAQVKEAIERARKR
ncbi:c-type cytochrome biogenesis protein CcmI [Desertibaculum subflavum]|uniref:c-type cytochrome biogenesis protein CcmI n=1 Tax=Desertibaculum subflavum TaxID=2268458 RepID=UPI000E65F3A8